MGRSDIDVGPGIEQDRIGVPCRQSHRDRRALDAGGTPENVGADDHCGPGVTGRHHGGRISVAHQPQCAHEGGIRLPQRQRWSVTHPHDLGGVDDLDLESADPEATQFGLQATAVSDEEDSQPKIASRGNGPLHESNGGPVTTHRIERDAHLRAPLPRASPPTRRELR